MSRILLAVAQFAPTDDGGNLAVIESLVAEAAGRGARVVVLPEYSSWFRVPFDAALREHAEDVPGPFTGELQRIAAAHDVVVVAGLVERAEGDRVFNAVVAVDANGVLASYRKQHLYDAFGDTESDWIQPGDLGGAAVFDVDGVRFGLITCYDLRFPESSRIVVDAGAQVVVVPAEWVRGPLKEHHWTTLLRARAIENTVYVAAADHTPAIGVGRSLIVDPSGIDVAGLGTEPGVAVASVDTDEIDRVRALNPSLAVRRYRVVPR